jgi:hypothetical protein
MVGNNPKSGRPLVEKGKYGLEQLNICKRKSPLPLSHTTHKYSHQKDQSQRESRSLKASMKAIEVAQQRKYLHCKSDNLSLIPRSCIKMEGEKKVREIVLRTI